MHIIESAVEPLRGLPLEIRCEPLPLFDSTNVASVRQAFSSATPCPLQQAWRNTVEPGFAPAVVRVGWRDNTLLVFAELTDADIFSSATRLNQRAWELGDVFEMFLRSTEKESYAELQVTSNNQRLQLRYPDAAAIETARRTRNIENVLVPGEAFHSRTWISDGAWQVYAEVPALTVCDSDLSLENTRWHFSFARYDYTRGMIAPVISCTSPHPKADFHRQSEWGVLTFQPRLRF